MNVTVKMIHRKKTTLVFGLRSRLKNGPIMINTRPSIEEIKNLGKRNAFSQKSGISCI